MSVFCDERLRCSDQLRDWFFSTDWGRDMLDRNVRNALEGARELVLDGEVVENSSVVVEEMSIILLSEWLRRYCLWHIAKAPRLVQSLVTLPDFEAMASDLVKNYRIA